MQRQQQQNEDERSQIKEIEKKNLRRKQKLQEIRQENSRLGEELEKKKEDNRNMDEDYREYVRKLEQIVSGNNLSLDSADPGEKMLVQLTNVHVNGYPMPDYSCERQ